MINEIKERLGSSIQVSDVLDVKKLPGYAKDSIEFLRSKIDDTPDDIFLQVLNIKLAQLMSYNRIKFTGSEATRIIGKPIVNMYGINLLKSGGGKDKTIDTIDNYFLDWFEEEFNNNNEKYIEKSEEILRLQADAKFGNSKAEAAKYIKDHMPRSLKIETGFATYEGFESDRQAAYKAGFGSVFVRYDELALKLKAMKTEDVGFFQALISSSEGKLSPKSIKSELNTVVTRDVPNNVLMYSSPKKLESGAIRDNFMTFLEIGFARRCIICYPVEKEKKQFANFAEMMKHQADLRNNSKDPSSIANKLKTAFDKTSSVFDTVQESHVYKEFHLKEEKAVEKYCMYQYYCTERCKAESISDLEIKDRYWKMIKLATLIASIEHPDELEVKESDIDYAIYQIEHFGKQAEKFFKADKGDAQMLFDIISKRPMGRSDLKALNIVPNGRFREWFLKVLPDLQDVCHDNGMTLIEVKIKKGVTYSIEPRKNTEDETINQINEFIGENQ